ncbi:MAG: hypothetical protein J4F31_02215 [Flavobacteriales bacterium]|nr:hypothetical protein [Flavobacteriales bacterium]
MKKLFLTLTLALASTALFAQIPSMNSMGIDPGKQTDMLMEQLASKIDMSDEQVAKMTDIHNEFFKAADKIVESGTMEQMNKLMGEKDSKVQSLLSKEDFIKYKEVTKQSTGALLDKMRKKSKE